MPGTSESSTFEWQSAQVTPTLVSAPASLTVPLTPTTALARRRSSVTAGLVEIHLPGFERRHRLGRQGLGIDLQADRERGLRIELCDRLVHPERAGPELLVTEGVEAEDVAAGRGRGRTLRGLRTRGQRGDEHQERQRCHGEQWPEAHSSTPFGRGVPRRVDATRDGTTFVRLECRRGLLVAGLAATRLRRRAASGRGRWRAPPRRSPPAESCASGPKSSRHTPCFSHSPRSMCSIRVFSRSARRSICRSRWARLSARRVIRFCDIRTKIARKIASSDTTRVRKLNGKGSNGATPGTAPRFTAIQSVNPITWAATKAALPATWVSASLRRSAEVRSCIAARSSCAIARTLRSVCAVTPPLSVACLARIGWVMWP